MYFTNISNMLIFLTNNNNILIFLINNRKICISLTKNSNILYSPTMFHYVIMLLVLKFSKIDFILLVTDLRFFQNYIVCLNLLETKLSLYLKRPKYLLYFKFLVNPKKKFFFFFFDLLIIAWVFY